MGNCKSTQRRVRKLVRNNRVIPRENLIENVVEAIYQDEKEGEQDTNNNHAAEDSPYIEDCVHEVTTVETVKQSFGKFRAFSILSVGCQDMKKSLFQIEDLGLIYISKTSCPEKVSFKLMSNSQKQFYVDPREMANSDLDIIKPVVSPYVKYMFQNGCFPTQKMVLVDSKTLRYELDRLAGKLQKAESTVDLVKRENTKLKRLSLDLDVQLKELEDKYHETSVKLDKVEQDLFTCEERAVATENELQKLQHDLLVDRESDIVIKECKMANSVQYKTISILMEAIDRYYSWTDVSSYVRDCLDIEFGRQWQCIIGRLLPYNGMATIFNGNDFALINVGRTHILVFRSHVTIPWMVSKSVKSMEEEAIKVADSVINKHLGPRKIAWHIWLYFKNKYPSSNWTCIVQDRYVHSSHLGVDYIEFYRKGIYITLFQTPKK
ncbi:hypothetical protein HDE_04109 [Halotydeus destructor]|nr:hypothetical protein HDE_04109 [Halotydeus destructor]